MVRGRRCARGSGAGPAQIAHPLPGLPFAAIMRNCRAQADGRMFDAVRLFPMRNPLPGNSVMKVDKVSMSVGVAECAR